MLITKFQAPHMVIDSEGRRVFLMTLKVCYVAVPALSAGQTWRFFDDINWSKDDKFVKGYRFSLFFIFSCILRVFKIWNSIWNWWYCLVTESRFSHLPRFAPFSFTSQLMQSDLPTKYPSEWPLHSPAAATLVQSPVTNNSWVLSTPKSWQSKSQGGQVTRQGLPSTWKDHSYSVPYNYLGKCYHRLRPIEGASRIFFFFLLPFFLQWIFTDCLLSDRL